MKKLASVSGALAFFAFTAAALLLMPSSNARAAAMSAGPGPGLCIDGCVGQKLLCVQKATASFQVCAFRCLASEESSVGVTRQTLRISVPDCVQGCEETLTCALDDGVTSSDGDVTVDCTKAMAAPASATPVSGSCAEEFGSCVSNCTDGAVEAW